MFAQLLESIKINDTETGFLTDSRCIGIGYKTSQVDVEIAGHVTHPDVCANFISSIPTDTKVRMLSRCTVESKNDPLRGVRAEDLKKIGNINYSLDIFLEQKVKGISVKKTRESITDLLKQMRATIDPKIFKQLGLLMEPITDYSEYFESPSIVRLSPCGLQADSKFYAVLKLVKLGSYGIDLYDVMAARDDLPLPNTFSFTVRKLSDSETQLFLKKKSKQESAGNDLASFKKFEDVQNSIVQADLSGRKFVEFELNIILESDDEKQLLQDLFEARNRLKGIGQFEPEIIGVIPSIQSAKVGGKSHHLIIERDDKVQTYFPIYSRGNNVLPSQSKRLFTFHRSNNSLAALDPYSTNYLNYSGVIIGQSGRGKSVFNNTLLRCLLNDENCKVILVDVMGSYTNLVKKLGGSIHRINSTDPSGISPFEFLSKRKDKAVIEIVLDYIEKLILEDDETSLRKSEQVELEKAFMAYLESNPTDPSIDSFLAFSKDIPRRLNLERWRSKGLFGNIFLATDQIKSSRLQYFDFTEISGAANGGVSKAVMSAIMAHFNFLLLSKRVDEKLIFMCDETPFFVKNCYSSFTLLSKNVRKLSGSLILTAQMLSDLVVNNDASLVAQSEFKILFSCDGTDEFFKTYSGVTEETLQTLKELRPSRGEFSLFILKDGQGERLCKLILSKEEYYTSSTHSDDKSLIQKCKELFSLKDEAMAIKAITTIREAGII